MRHPAPQRAFILKMAGGFMAIVAILGVLAACSAGDKGAPTPTPTDPPVPKPTRGRQEMPTPPAATQPDQSSQIEQVDDQVAPTPGPGDVGAVGGKVGVAEGFIADGEWVSVFDTHLPAVGNLQPGLLAAIQRAHEDAVRDGVDLFITSGWRSERYQQGLLDSAVVTYGSLAEALRWVNTPEESSHVTGDAVDVGPTDAAYWLSQYGSAYGLCQTYANEIWHYELATAPGGTCPPPISDASAGSAG